MTCTDVRRLLAAYVDGEVSGAERLLASSHLSVCRTCAREEADLRDLGDMLRGTAALSPAPLDDLNGLAGGVVSRIGAETQQSFAAKWARVFDDWHWVAIGSGACGAAFVSAMLVFAMLYSPTTQARQMNEKVGTLYLMAVPEDGKGRPVMLEFEQELGEAKPASRKEHRYAMPASFGWKGEQALVTRLDESLMRYGRSVSFHDLSREDREEVISLLNEISRMRQVQRSRRPTGDTAVTGMHLFVNEVVTAAGL